MGTVINYDPEKGYGRIQDEQNRDFFVHFRDIFDGFSLQAGQKVKFLGHLHRKGNIAREVRPA